MRKKQKMNNNIIIRGKHTIGKCIRSLPLRNRRRWWTKNKNKKKNLFIISYYCERRCSNASREWKNATFVHRCRRRHLFVDAKHAERTNRRPATAWIVQKLWQNENRSPFSRKHIQHCHESHTNNCYYYLFVVRSCVCVCLTEYMQTLQLHSDRWFASLSKVKSSVSAQHTHTARTHQIYVRR